MSWYEWIPAVSTSALLGVAMSIAGLLLRTRLVKSVQHEFNEKLESIRAAHKKDEEAFKAELASREAQLSVLRNYLVSGMSGRQVIVEKRRIKAVDELWDSVLSLAPLKNIASIMSKINFETALKHAETDPNTRRFFDDIGMGFDIKALRPYSAPKARPFLSQMSWALFEAYRSVLYQALIKYQMAKSGLNEPQLIERTRIKELLMIALPHQVDYIDQCRDGEYFYLVDELESLVLVELTKMIQGVESDKASLERASDILKAAGLLASDYKSEPV